MSQKAKRVWTAGAVGVAVLAVAVAALLIWQVHLRAATAGEGGGAEPLEAATYRGVSELRSRVRLSDATLGGPFRLEWPIASRRRGTRGPRWHLTITVPSAGCRAARAGPR